MKWIVNFQENKSLFKEEIKKSWIKTQICTKLTIKALKYSDWHHLCFHIANFEETSIITLVSSLEINVCSKLLKEICTFYAEYIKSKVTAQEQS